MNQILDVLAGLWQNSTKIAFLGIGSPLRADDSVGLYLVQLLEEDLSGYPGKELKFFLGESAPENFSGAIREFAPEQLVIFDAADLGEKPGTFALIEQDRIAETSFSTHMLPLKILVAYLVQVTGCQITIIGTQPKSFKFAEALSGEVKEGAEQFVKGFVSRVTK